MLEGSEGMGELSPRLGISTLRAMFQPIFDLSASPARVHMLEALTRGASGSHWERPSVLFAYARNKGAEPLLDRAAIRGALEVAGRFKGAPLVSLNVHASTLHNDAEFVAFLLDSCSR